MADDKKLKAVPPTDHTDLADTPDLDYPDGLEVEAMDPAEIAKMKGGHVRKTDD